MTLTIQCAGGGLLAVQNEKIFKVGEGVELFGLASQLAFFAAFAVIVVHVHVHARHLGLAGRPGLRRLFFVLYATIVLLNARMAFRVAEFSQGWHGYLATNERLFYGLDCALVAATIALLTLLHPGVLLLRVAGGVAVNSGDEEDTAGGVDAVVLTDAANNNGQMIKGSVGIGGGGGKDVAVVAP